MIVDLVIPRQTAYDVRVTPESETRLSGQGFALHEVRSRIADRRVGPHVGSGHLPVIVDGPLRTAAYDVDRHVLVSRAIGIADRRVVDSDPLPVSAGLGIPRRTAAYDVDRHVLVSRAIGIADRRVGPHVDSDPLPVSAGLGIPRRTAAYDVDRSLLVSHCDRGPARRAPRRSRPSAGDRRSRDPAPDRAYDVRVTPESETSSSGRDSRSGSRDPASSSRDPIDHLLEASGHTT